VNPFAKSPVGKLVAAVCQLPRRPSEILGIQGSEWEKLLWDAAVLSELAKSLEEPKSTAEAIRRKRAKMEMYG